MKHDVLFEANLQSNLINNYAQITIYLSELTCVIYGTYSNNTHYLQLFILQELLCSHFEKNVNLRFSFVCSLQTLLARLLDCDM